MFTRRVIDCLYNYGASAFSFIGYVRSIAAHIRSEKNAPAVRRFICWVICVGLLVSNTPASTAMIGWRPSKSKARLAHRPPERKFPDLDRSRRLTPAIPKTLSQVSVESKPVKKNNRVVDLLTNAMSYAWPGSFFAFGMISLSDLASGADDVRGEARNTFSPTPSRNKSAATATGSVGRSRSADAAALAFQGGDDNWPMAMLAPANRVGAGGEDLLSRNYNWALPLVALPGRAGLNLNLTLSLNSLIWIKSGGDIHFNKANGFPSPGFHLGFPELKTYFYNSEAGVGSRLVIMPSGKSFEFWENPALGNGIDYIYEERNGSNMIIVETPGLFDHNETVWRLLTPDGTACKYVVVGSNPKCVEIKDRNGNYISVAYNTSTEKMTRITDTVGHEVNFNYDSNNRLTSITQNWGGQTHTWATFAYSTVTISAGFLSLNMVGAQNGQVIPVLSRVGLADGSVHSFDYNTYGQVRTIRRYAPKTATPGSFPGDYTQLSYVTYDLPLDGTGQQDDCPRFNTRKDWADNWNNNNEVSTTFDGDLSSWGSVTTPDEVTYKEFYGAGGSWQRGLTTRTETWSGEVMKKWVTLQWTQDNTGLVYPLNPRLTETNVYDDANNRRRTRMSHTSYGLVSDVYEYGADATTVLRSTHTDYNLSEVYTSRRIIGLPSAVYLYDGDDALFSKVTYEYDDLGDEYLDHQGPPIRHDTANYGPTFVKGRGNLNRVRRWNVNDPDNVNKSTASTMGFNTSGSMIFSRDPLNHKTMLSYEDSFSDSVNTRNTFAYPTTITDADQFPSTVQYNYDFGAVTRTQDPKGAAVVNTYDSIGRLARVTNQVNQAYTRYVYATNHLQVESFTTINDLSSEFYQIAVFDGHGRTRGAASDHPGSAGGYKAQSYEYDIMGRLVRQTNPTEVNGDWEPTGDDPGWVWSSQAYDWQGRPMVSTNQDGTTRSIGYEGCGCSGGDVVTLTDEGTLVNGTLQRRKQKIYNDVLGRVVKSEIYDWNNNVYTTATQAYNVRNQVTTATLRQGSGGASQVTTFGYDGHGRPSTRQLPSASAPSSFVYNADDTVQVATDARGATSTYSYNNRRQVTGITYDAPSGVAATPNVTFGYDEAGNQTSMTDGLGSATYHYDALSRMDQETRVLTGVGSFTINYAYNLSGQLTSVTDPASDSVSYVYNRAGQIAAVNGSDYAGVTQYAGGLQFRAWGGLKKLSYGNGLSLVNNYDARLQLQQMEVKGVASSGSPSLMKIQYQYYPDGTPKFAQDLQDSRFDRAWTYDYVGRLSEAYTGQEADNYAGVSVPVPQSGPYRHTHQYDVWNNLTSRTGRYWSQTSDFMTTYNGQNQRQGWTYDAAGNLLNDETNQYVYDAAGRNVSAGGVTQAFDGLGQAIKRTGLDNKVAYYLYSRPLGGQLLTELYGTPGQATPVGAKIRGYVYAGGGVVAKQEKSGVDYTNSLVEWEHQDYLTGSLATSRKNGSFRKKREPDPMGVAVGLSDPLEEPPIIEGGEAQLLDVPGFFPDGRCTLDGVAIGCSMVSSLLDSGAAAVGPKQTTAPIYSKALGKYVGVGIYNPNSGSYESQAEVDKELERTIVLGGQVIGKWRDSIKVPADVRAETIDVMAGEFIGGRGLLRQNPTQLPLPISRQQLDQLIRDANIPRRPCPSVPLAPPDVSIDENIRTARRHEQTIKGPYTAGRQALWFHNQIKPGGPWDYKKYDKNYDPKKASSIYEDFGNFNFGATGAALGISSDILERGAGRIQDPKAPNVGGKKAGWLDARLGQGGKWPYGDQYDDNAQVRAGVEYYYRKFVNKDCK